MSDDIQGDIRWKQRDENGFILPYFIHKTISASFSDKIKTALTKLDDSGELGCIKLKHVKNPYTVQYDNGIVFAMTNLGCFSALGFAPGFTGGYKSTSQLGVKRNWQLVSLRHGLQKFNFNEQFY